LNDLIQRMTAWGQIEPYMPIATSGALQADCREAAKRLIDLESFVSRIHLDFLASEQAWKKRAEKAEAKLAEYQTQEGLGK